MPANKLFYFAIMFATLALGVAKMDSPDSGMPYRYKGMMVWAFGWAFLNAFSIGANDVANAFANAVGSRTITHRQACMIACVGEMLGVLVLGKTVTDTVRKKMVSVDNFKEDPYVFALGMSCVSLGSGIWVFAATLLCLPVSTTHAVVGSILGVGITAWGSGGVNWGYDGGVLGVVASWFISPVLSGIIAAIFYLAIKYLVLLHPDDIALKKGIFYLPIFFFLSFGIVAGFMFLKGAPAAKDWPISQSLGLTFGVAILFGLVGKFLVVPWLRRTIIDRENLPWYTLLYHFRVPVGSYNYFEHDQDQIATDAKGKLDEGKGVSGQDSEPRGMQSVSCIASESMPKRSSLGAIAGAQGPTTAGNTPKAPLMVLNGAYPMPAASQLYSIPGIAGMGSQYGQSPAMIYGHSFGGAVSGAGAFYGDVVVPVRGSNFGMDLPEVNPDDPWYTKLCKKAAPGMYMDVGALREEDAAMHANAFKALPLTEELFKSLQLTTCLFFSIAHGANDIANALAPLASVWLVYSTGKLSSKAPIPIWIMIYGGVALDIGLLCMGHHIMAALGNRLTLQSPSRGFTIQLGAMLTVMVFSRLGFPISTTHCLTGATTGVGLCNGSVKAVNWRLLAQIFGGWIITCPAAGLITGIVFWGIASAPKPMSENGYFQGHYRE